jgi:structure-specific endonuclease subunit SLX1
VCPLGDCHVITHLHCLSQRFLKEEGRHDAMVPIGGACPGCRSPIQWSTVVKELSLRRVGQRDIDKMLKSNRRQKDGNMPEQGLLEHLTSEESDEELDENWIHEVDDELEAG